MYQKKIHQIVNFFKVAIKMPGSRRMILKHVMSNIWTRMHRTKQMPSDIMETPLNRCLNTFDITLLGKHYFKTLLSNPKQEVFSTKVLNNSLYLLYEFQA